MLAKKNVKSGENIGEGVGIQAVLITYGSVRKTPLPLKRGLAFKRQWRNEDAMQSYRELLEIVLKGLRQIQL